MARSSSISPASATSRRCGAACRRDGYRLLPYTHEFGAALAAADLALARAGGSVYELAAAGTPAVLVPYPHATGDHQTKNARHFERAGAAVVVPEPELAVVPDLVSSLARDAARLATMAAAMRRLARPHAADEIAEEVLAACRVLEGRRLWFVGIGGAGMSALAVVARAWGAEVAGWDRHETPYLAAARQRRGRDLTRAGRPPPDGWEPVVSTAYRRLRSPGAVAR